MIRTQGHHLRDPHHHPGVIQMETLQGVGACTLNGEGS